MITFVNKEAENLKEGSDLLTYANFSLLCLNSPVGQGMTVEEIEERLELRGKFKDLRVKGELKLQRKEYDLLAKCVKGMRWGIVHEAIPIFAKYIRSLNPDIQEASEDKA